MPLNALLRGCRRDARIVITRFDFEYYLGKITFWTVYCNALKTTILKENINCKFFKGYFTYIIKMLNLQKAKNK